MQSVRAAEAAIKAKTAGKKAAAKKAGKNKK
jgi:hypothetical protein